MARRIRDFDWADTALGAIDGWPISLRTVVGLMTASDNPMVLLWGPDGVLIYNDGYARFAGVRHPSALGLAAAEAWPEIADFNTENIHRGLTGEAWSLSDRELVLDRKGTPESVWMDLSYTPIPDDSGRPAGVLVFVTETTDRVLADRQSEAARERLEMALTASDGVGAWEWDVVTDQVFADANFARIYGVDPRKAKRGAPLAEFFGAIHPDDAPRVQGEIDTALKTGEPFSSEYRLVQDDGKVRWVIAQGRAFLSPQGQPLRFPGVTFDITERRLIAEALSVSEARYRTLFETMDEGFCVIEFIDGPHGPLSDYVHVEANAAYAENAGIPDVVGQKIRTMVGAEAQEWIDLYKGVLDTGQSIRFEKELVETGRWLELAAFRIEPASRNQVAVLFKDLTQRKTAEMALRELNADLERKVIERTQARGVSWMVSPDLMGALSPEGRFVTSNPAWLTVLGWTEAEVASTSIFELLHPDDVERTRAGFDLTQIGQPAIRFPNRYRCKDDSYRWISWVGVPEDGLVYCVGRDITEEKSRADERDRLWSLSSDMLARADYGGGMSAVNPAWTRVLGWSEVELLTNPYADIIDPDDVPATTAALAEMGETGQPTRFQNRILAKDGVWKPIDWTVAPEPDGENFIAVGRDLSEDKAREAELQAAQEALRQSQKMEAVGQLTGGIAHDFNNLLAGISGSLELLGKRLAEGRLAGMERYIDAAQGAAQRAAALTQRLLAFSRRQTLDPRPIDMNRLILGMEELVRRSVGPNVEVEVVGAGVLWTVRIDQSQLENALLNLCINARDAMTPNGGHLTIETANKWLDERSARERDLPPGQYVSLCVTDTGIGMTPDTIEKIFDPFFTTKPMGQGTGLGLSMIHGFVRQSGGQVRVYSEPGEGTTMCLYFPRHHGDAETAGNTLHGDIAHGGNGETILVIDDHDIVRMLIVEVLNEAGYDVVSAEDGPSGLQILNSDARIDLLITDVGLPGGMNGRQIADAAREGRPDLKVLFITGYAENAAVGNGLLAPGMEVMTKPFVMTDLALKVTEIIDS